MLLYWFRQTTRIRRHNIYSYCRHKISKTRRWAHLYFAPSATHLQARHRLWLRKSVTGTLRSCTLGTVYLTAAQPEDPIGICTGHTVQTEASWCPEHGDDVAWARSLGTFLNLTLWLIPCAGVRNPSPFIIYPSNRPRVDKQHPASVAYFQPGASASGKTLHRSYWIVLVSPTGTTESFPRIWDYIENGSGTDRFQPSCNRDIIIIKTEIKTKINMIIKLLR